MDLVSQLLPIDRLPADTQQLLVDWGTVHLATFGFVVCRLAGFLALLPLIVGAAVPWHFRALLVLALALAVTPAVTDLAPAVATPDQTTLPGWLWQAVQETLVGLALGFGVLVTFAGLQMAGELIDLKAGLRPGALFQSGGLPGTSVTGRFLLLTGLATFLMLPPLPGGTRGGLLLLVDAFVESFRALPPGAGMVRHSLPDIATGLIQHSLALTLLVTAPVLAISLLIALLFGFLGRSVPETNVFWLSFPVRAAACLGVVALSLSGITGAVVRQIPVVLSDVAAAFT